VTIEKAWSAQYQPISPQTGKVNHDREGEQIPKGGRGNEQKKKQKEGRPEQRAFFPKEEIVKDGEIGKAANRALAKLALKKSCEPHRAR